MSDILDIIATAESMPAAKPLGTTPEIETYEDETAPEVRGLAWRVTDLSSADWALRRVAECEAEAAEVDRQVAEAIAAIEKRGAELKAKAARGADYFRFMLTMYAETHRDSLLTGKKKSRDLVHGRIAFRASPERLKVTDPAALEAWLSAQPVESGLYRVKIEPEMRALQARHAHLEALFREAVAAGTAATPIHIPPGCAIEPSRESITITATAPEAALMRKG